MTEQPTDGETIPDWGDDVPVVDDAEPDDADVDHTIDVEAES